MQTKHSKPHVSALFSSLLLTTLFSVTLYTLLFLATPPTTAAPTAGIIYVNANQTSNPNDGTSWENAYANLQDGLAAATSGTEIWVAGGVYTPGNTISDTFVLTDGVAIYGGFAATETVRDERDYTNNLAILSGDIGGDDIAPNGVVTATANITGSNSYHVVSADGVTNTAVLDGFTITAGQADGSGSNNNGGGMVNNNSSPTLSNISFSGNSASLGGGIANNGNSSPTLSNVSFSGNSTGNVGGGMYNVNSSPALRNVSFSGNSAGFGGGGIFNAYSSPTLSNVSFSGNSASNGGGIYNTDSNLTLSNVSFSGNAASSDGGGLFNANSSLTVVNTIIWNNSSGGFTNTARASIYNGGGTQTFSHSLIANSGGSDSWDSSIGTDGGNNIDEDPFFTTAIDPITAPTTLGNLQLQSISPAINAGNTVSYTSPITQDLAGNLRIQDTIIDMGAYEFTCPLTTTFVNHAATADNNGTSWTNAFTDLQTALTAARICPAVSEIWVAAGIYTPGSTISDTFVLTDGVAIYGGFVATETVRSERDYTNNLTVLSGDIDGDDTNTDGVVVTTTNQIGDNSYHVVSADGVTNTAVLDGFTITAGQADGDYPNNYGGGMVNESNSSPTLRNLIFSGNSTELYGGGMYNDSSSPTLSDVTFSGNYGSGNGGGMANSESSPTLSNVTFFGNATSGSGGGMANEKSSPTLSNVTFSGNVADRNGGGMRNEQSNPTLSNVVFSGNTTTNGDGGGMANFENSSPTLSNVTFSGNTADDYGGGIYNNGNSNPTIVNTIVWDNSAGGVTNTITASISSENSSAPIISYSLIAHSGGSDSWNGSIGTDEGSNIDSDPLFMIPINPSTAPTTAGDLQLQAGSPAINAGNTISYTDISTETTDLAGNIRIFMVIDIGAYEYSYHVFIPIISKP